jgi:hypothetical protein
MDVVQASATHPIPSWKSLPSHTVLKHFNHNFREFVKGRFFKRMEGCRRMGLEAHLFQNEKYLINERP